MTNMKPKVLTLMFLSCITVLLFCPLAQAKPSIDLSFEKNNGYGVGNDIGGLWTATALVSSDVQFVEFYLDNQLLQNDTSAPFSWQFDTSNYSSGAHVMKAVAYDSQGETAFLQINRNFQETSTTTVTIIIVAIAITVVVVSVVVALYWKRKT
jgi:uncharacterized membrane protein YidH (DUF202 family)